MIEDLRHFSEGGILDADVCIVGAGAAGIAIASEFVGSSFKILLLESGHFHFDDRIQELYRGQQVGEEYFRALDDPRCRTRQFGGSTNRWGSMSAPLAPIDFAKRDWIPDSGWPISYAEMEPYYRRAHEMCGLGPYVYGEPVWREIGVAPQPFDPKLFSSHFWHFNNRRRIRMVNFGRKYASALKAARNVRVLLNANATELLPTRNGGRIREVIVKTLNGKQFSVKVRLIILAAGAIENVRLLLCSDRVHPNGVGNDRDLVGRFFMEHPHSCIGSVKLNRPILGYTRMWPLGDAHCRAGLALSPDAQRIHRCGNASVAMEPVYDPQSAWVVCQQAWRELSSKRLKAATFRKMVGAIPGLPGLMRDLYSRLAHGVDPPGRSNECALYVRAEQAPDPSNRVKLSTDSDALAMRRVCLDWHTTSLDRRPFQVIAKLLKSEFSRLGLGEVREEEWVTDGGWPASVAGGPHHMGTTRMSESAQNGVVDPDCQVHGVEGLYVAGSSVFPTGGHANPTLTLLMLALRLADLLKNRLQMDFSPSVASVGDHQKR